jgi:transposase-like protein
VSRQRKPSRQASVDEQMQVVLAVLKGELSLAEAARRHGVTSATVGNWRDRFVDAGKAGMDRSLPGPDGGRSQTERRLRLAAGGQRMVRYDLRDCGASTTVDPEAPGYNLRDLAADAIPAARLLVLDDMGTALRDAAADEVTAAMLAL